MNIKVCQTFRIDFSIHVFQIVSLLSPNVRSILVGRIQYFTTKVRNKVWTKNDRIGRRWLISCVFVHTWTLFIFIYRQSYFGHWPFACWSMSLGYHQLEQVTRNYSLLVHHFVFFIPIRFCPPFSLIPIFPLLHPSSVPSSSLHHP